MYVSAKCVNNCISQIWITVLHQICSTTVPFDLRCESVTKSFILHEHLIRYTQTNSKIYSYISK